MKKKLKRTKRGVINLPFVMFILIFGLVLFITLEYFIQNMGCKAKVVSGDMVKKWQKTNDEGVWQYDINVDKITFDKGNSGQSPKITIEGSMTYYPMCVKNIIKSETNTRGTITMPFKREVENNINAG